MKNNQNLNNVDKYNEVLPQRLRELKEVYYIDKILSYRKIADAIGEDNSQTVNRWFLGEATPNVFQLKKLAKFFGVTTDYLLGGEYESPDIEIREKLIEMGINREICVMLTNNDKNSPKQLLLMLINEHWETMFHPNQKSLLSLIKDYYDALDIEQEKITINKMKLTSDGAVFVENVQDIIDTNALKSFIVDAKINNITEYLIKHKKKCVKYQSLKMEKESEIDET